MLPAGMDSSLAVKAGNLFEKIKGKQLFDICYAIDENEWNGKKNVQLRIRDIKNTTV